MVFLSVSAGLLAVFHSISIACGSLVVNCHMLFGIKNILFSNSCKNTKTCNCLQAGFCFMDDSCLLASPHPVCLIGSGFEPTIVGSLFAIGVTV